MTYNIVAWITAIGMIVLTLILAYAEFFQPPPAPTV